LILIIVLDGLRPDQINPSDTPNLLRLARRGVEFRGHHAVFPTHTRVNVATLFTGRYPAGHGLVGNTLFMPELDPAWKVSTGQRDSILGLERRLNGRLLTAETLGEVLHSCGKSMVAMGVGSSGNTALHHHKAASVGGTVIHPDFTVPESLEPELTSRYGPWPDTGVPNHARIERAVTVLLDYVLPAHAPDVATLWMSDPDSTQHKTGVGSPAALDSLHRADAQLGRILEHLENTGLAGTADVLVLSDHGHSTVHQVIDIEGLLIQKGIKRDKSSTDILVADNGGCASVYVTDHGVRTIASVVEAVVAESWCGPVFVRDTAVSIPGAIPHSRIMYDHPRAPDVLVSFAWTDESNIYGVSGSAGSSGDVGVGLGDHGSLSPNEVHNVLLAAGPTFQRGFKSHMASGNVDIFPTVLHILGLTPAGPVDGRVLTEALAGGGGPGRLAVSTRLHQASTRIAGGEYRQEVQVTQVDGTMYVDHGRAEHL